LFLRFFENRAPDFYTIRKIIHPRVLRRKVGGGQPILPKILGQPLERNRQLSTDIRCRASAVTSSEKSSINTNRKSTTRFPMSGTWPLSPLTGAQKRKTADSVCYKVSLCENCQRQSCKVFIGLTIRAKIIGGRRPLLPEILDQTDRVGAKSPIFDLFSLVATQS